MSDFGKLESKSIYGVFVTLEIKNVVKDNAEFVISDDLCLNLVAAETIACAKFSHLGNA